MGGGGGRAGGRGGGDGGWVLVEEQRQIPLAPPAGQRIRQGKPVQIKSVETSDSEFDLVLFCPLDPRPRVSLVESLLAGRAVGESYITTHSHTHTLRSRHVTVGGAWWRPLRGGIRFPVPGSRC